MMTDNEIIKALEEELKTALTINHRFEESNDTENPDDHRFIALLSDTIKLINLQKAEIEELKSDIAILKDSNINLQELYYTEKEKVTQAKTKVVDACKMRKTAKSEAIKEFAERLKGLLSLNIRVTNEDYLDIAVEIDNLVKEVFHE